MASREPSSLSPAPRVPQWQVEYESESALQETDRKALFKRIEVAEAAILSRREVLLQGPDGHAEQNEIKVALEKIRSLKKALLKF